MYKRKEENGEDEVQKKRRTEEGQVVEATDEVRWTAMGGSIQVIAIKTWKGKIFLHLSVDSIPAEICLLAEIHQNRPKMARTNWNLVRGGTRGWFILV